MAILHNVRKFYGTDLYEVEDVISYSRGSSHYGTPVYVAGLSDYCMYYSESLGSFILEQHDPINNEWNQVDSIPVINVPTSVRFTFDQNGHIAIVWESGNDIYRYWYDTAVNEAITTHVGKGRSPHILMESYNEVLQPVRQIVMVYVTDDDRLVYRLQDDRYTVEYFIEDNVEAVVMLGHTVRNSVKLVYLAREGIYNYRYKAVGSDRLGEWFGDNAAGEDIQFIIEDLSLESVIHTLPFSENPVNLDRSLSNVNLRTIPSVVDKSIGTENPVSISRSLSNLSITKRPTIFTEEFEEPVPSPILSGVLLDSLYLDIHDVRIDIVQEELVIPPPIQTNIEDIRLEIYVEVAQLAMLYNQLLGQNLDESDFTVESWAVYMAAMDAAENVIDDPTASRTLVTDTFYNLREARHGLIYVDLGGGGDINPPSGVLAQVYACNITDRMPWNPNAVTEPTYEERYGKVVNYYNNEGISLPLHYVKTNNNNAYAEIPTVTVPLPNLLGRILYIYGRNGTWSTDIVDGLYEFLDSSGNTLLVLHVYKQTTFGTNIKYGTSINSMTAATYTVRGNVRGNLVFDVSGVSYIPDSVESSGSFIEPFEVLCNTAAIDSLRVTASALSTYTSGDGGQASTYILLRDIDFQLE